MTEAREARGFTQTLLAERTGRKPQSISHYEQGRQSPSPEALELLCGALDVPLGFFLRPAPDVRRSASLGERRLGWVKEIGAYLASFLNLPPVRLARVVLPVGARSEQIERTAEETRQALDLGYGPIGDLFAVLESAGCIVSAGAADLHPPVSQWDAGVPWMLTSLCPWQAAHELAALLTDRHRDRFARAFLLPAAGFAAEVWAPTLEALFTLRRVWNCPVDMMIRRCEDLGIFDGEQARRALARLERRGADADEPAVGPSLLGRSMRLIIDAGVKDRRSVLHDLALNPKDIEELTGLPRGYLTEGSLVVAPEPKPRVEAQNFEGSIRQTL